MDYVFGIKNFRNEIVWHYTSGQGSKKHYPKKHDILLFYSKTDIYTHNSPVEVYTEKELKRFNQIEEETGKRFYWNGKEGLKYKTYLTKEGKLIPDVFIIENLTNQAERLGYPTQKPEALLERIIKASSNEGDLVMDFYNGGGTTGAVCKKLGRNYLGVDINYRAIQISQERLDKITI
jgi:DNA modification methylase